MSTWPAKKARLVLAALQKIGWRTKRQSLAVLRSHLADVGRLHAADRAAGFGTLELAIL